MTTSEFYDKADFRVEPDKQQWGNLMKTMMMNSECREPGLYTLIPESYVVNITDTQSIYGNNLGKVHIHVVRLIEAMPSTFPFHRHTFILHLCATGE